MIAGGAVTVGGLVVSAVLSAIYLLFYCYRAASVGKTIIKTTSIGVLVLASFGMGGPVWLMFALGFCALGDYLLALDKDKAFLGGVGAFALGHVFYLIALLGHWASDLDRVLGGVQGVIALVLVCLAIIMARLLFQKAGDLRFAVLGYIPIIIGMGIAAMTLPMSGVLALVVVGGLLFVLSDLVLSLDMFVLKPDSRLARIAPFVIWTTYWGAQVTLLTGLSFSPV